MCVGVRAMVPGTHGTKPEMLSAKMVRAILIDPFAKTVSEVQHNASDYKNIYKVLGISTFDARAVDKTNSMFFDDDGLYKEDQHYFAIGREPHVAGKALILGVDGEGETADCTVPLQLVQRAVRFYKVQPVFTDVSQTSGPGEVFGAPGVHIVQTAHFDPEGELE